MAAKSQALMLALQTLAGAGSGAVTKTATAPLERVKIIFQVQVRLTQARLAAAEGALALLPAECAG